MFAGKSGDRPCRDRTCDLGIRVRGLGRGILRLAWLCPALIRRFDSSRSQPISSCLGLPSCPSVAPGSISMVRVRQRASHDCSNSALQLASRCRRAPGRYLPGRSRCRHPGQQQGRRWPSSSSSWVRRMRRSRVIFCLASSTQQMNSLRARGVMSFQASSAAGLATSALRRSVGSL